METLLSRPSPLPSLPLRCKVGASRPRRMLPHASPSDNGSGAQSDGGKSSTPLPEIGFFKIADPKAEVYSKAGDKFDPTKKGGRYKPEFIWNTNWQEQLKIQEDLETKIEEYKEQQKKGNGGAAAGPGVVSLSRLGALEDLSVDLTQQLVKKTPKSSMNGSASTSTSTSSSSSRDTQQQQLQQGQQRRRQASSKGASPSYQFKDMPTRVEARRFARATRVASKGTTITAVGQLTPEEAAAKAAVQAEERQRYEALKREFQLWTVVSAVVGTGITYAAYSKDTAISYAIGGLGGILYLRLLGRSVDALGGSGGGGGAPRLLIPLILALTYNRWNQLYAADYGFTLQLIPELLGFFTYKLAVVARQGVQVMAEFSQDVTYKGSSGSERGEGGGDEEGGAMTLDRIFVKKATSGW